MPWSSGEGKPWLYERIKATGALSMLDIGPGSGTYGRMLNWIDDRACIEIFEPYVERFGLADVYHPVIVADARTAVFPSADVVILGDVLEHMTVPEAVSVWLKAAGAARRALYLSLPIVEYPQGPSEGNDHEAHLATWSHDMVLDRLPGITAWETYREIGVYERPAT